MNSIKKLKIGLAGFGKHAKRIWYPILKDNLDFELTAISSEYENNNFSGKSLDNSLNSKIKLFTHHLDLIKYEELDCVLICTSNNLHGNLVIEALKNRKHVLCEKPLAFNTIELDQISTLLKKTSQILCTSIMYRTHPQWTYIKDFFTKIKKQQWRISGTFQYHLDSPNNIRFQEELGGGALLDAGCYFLDICEFLEISKPNKISSLATKNSIHDIDTACSLNMQFDNGQIADFYCSVLNSRYQEVKIFGEFEHLIVESPFVIAKGKKPKIKFIDSKGKEHIINFEQTDCYKLGLNLFKESITKGYKLNHLTDAINTSYLLAQIYESLKK